MVPIWEEFDVSFTIIAWKIQCFKKLICWWKSPCLNEFNDWQHNPEHVYFKVSGITIISKWECANRIVFDTFWKKKPIEFSEIQGVMCKIIHKCLALQSNNLQFLHLLTVNYLSHSLVLWIKKTCSQVNEFKIVSLLDLLNNNA